jgi:hypothetical protein
VGKASLEKMFSIPLIIEENRLEKMVTVLAVGIGKCEVMQVSRRLWAALLLGSREARAKAIYNSK